MNHLLQIDPLTEALNRRGLNAAFRRESARSRRTGQPLILIALDLDHFKRLNDTCGHDYGDAVLRHLVSTARIRLRSADVVARVGGEEFVILLPDTDTRRAALVMEDLQAAFAKQPSRALTPCESLRPSFSAGIACWMPSEEFSATYTRADRALLRAKAMGRCRVEHAGCHAAQADSLAVRA